MGLLIFVLFVDSFIFAILKALQDSGCIVREATDGFDAMKQYSGELGRRSSRERLEKGM